MKLARDQFNTYYDHTIRDLLSMFPKDHKDKDGQPFWSGPKRAPSPITFDASNETHINFILSYSNLIAATLNIPQVQSVDTVQKLVKKVKASTYVAKKIEVKLPEEEKNGQPEPAQAAAEAAPEDDEAIE